MIKTELFYVETDGGHTLYFDGYAGEYYWSFGASSTDIKVQLFGSVEAATNAIRAVGGEDGIVTIRENVVATRLPYPYTIRRFSDHKDMSPTQDKNKFWIKRLGLTRVGGDDTKFRKDLMQMTTDPKVDVGHVLSVVMNESD